MLCFKNLPINKRFLQCLMGPFEWLATLVQILTLKHEKLSNCYNFFDSSHY